VPMPPAHWLCNACEARVDAARALAVATEVARGAFEGRLTDPSNAPELVHAISVLLANNMDPLRVHRAVTSKKFRPRLAAALQEADEACLAAERPFSLRALLRTAVPDKRGFIFTRLA